MTLFNARNVTVGLFNPDYEALDWLKKIFDEIQPPKVFVPTKAAVDGLDQKEKTDILYMIADMFESMAKKGKTDEHTI